MFLERKITGRMHGEEFAEFSAILGWKALKDSVDQYGNDKHGFTQLVPSLEGHDPDDAFSSIPYVSPPEIQTYSRKKDSICCMKFRELWGVQKSLNLLCQLTLPTFVSSRLPRMTSRPSYTSGLRTSAARR